MNYLELINQCLIELNYKSVGAFDDLTTGDHKRLKDIINRLNSELVLGYDWAFRQAKSTVTLGTGTYEHNYPVEGKINNVYNDEIKCSYEPDYERFYEGTTSVNSYSIYANKFLMGPFNTNTDVDIFYYVNKPAKSAEGELKTQMILEDDEPIIPQEFAQNVIVYGACMRFKAMPSHPKYKHWSGEYVRGLRLLQGADAKTKAHEPRIILNRGV